MSGRGKKGKERASPSPPPEEEMEEARERVVPPLSHPAEGSSTQPYSRRMMEDPHFFNLVASKQMINLWWGTIDPKMSNPERMNPFSHLSGQSIEDMRVAIMMSLVCKKWHVWIKGMGPTQDAQADNSHGRNLPNLIPFSWFEVAHTQLMAMMTPAGNTSFRLEHGTPQETFTAVWRRLGLQLGEVKPLAFTEFDGITVQSWSSAAHRYVRAARESGRMTEQATRTFQIKVHALLRRYDLNMRILSGSLYFVIFGIAGLHLRSRDEQCNIRQWASSLMNHLHRCGDRTPHYHDIINAFFDRVRVICIRQMGNSYLTEGIANTHSPLNRPYYLFFQQVVVNIPMCQPYTGVRNGFMLQPFNLRQMVEVGNFSTYDDSMPQDTPFGLAVRNAAMYTAPLAQGRVLGVQVNLTELVGSRRWYLSTFRYLEEFAFVRALSGRYPVLSPRTPSCFQTSWICGHPTAPAPPIHIVQSQRLMLANRLWIMMMTALAGPHIQLEEDETGEMVVTFVW